MNIIYNVVNCVASALFSNEVHNTIKPSFYLEVENICPFPCVLELCSGKARDKLKFEDKLCAGADVDKVKT